MLLITLYTKIFKKFFEKDFRSTILNALLKFSSIIKNKKVFRIIKLYHVTLINTEVKRFHNRVMNN